MLETRNKIMDATDIRKTVKRIAYQIYETHFEETQLILAGIAHNGVILAKRIQEELESISDIEVIFVEIKVDKKNPINPIVLSEKLAVCENKAVVVVDDVLNTGSTLIYAVTHFLSIRLKKLQTAVLVNRNHKNFPIKGDFKGISLSTSTKEHIHVAFGDKEGVFLSE
ncbi:MAG: phosphoribosyltransferase [Flavobacteriaceae bacterium]|nr:phosphoribosyltransferase [Flavobacteriaceae bacterium]MDA8758354.1 phosphoribosyltransferase family protein [Flavobacteriaceae bacterium]MDB2315275.1 phosphoribosyltransferase family protein [Flavobacteriaceae bacterium]MDB2520762.1 phosphoribosyltransferase family protein [Flavobacteriaceae bacterium]MDC0479252.1 phosphoribosyltransferase family protein [Flavobacteriaceae bacterium]